MKVLIVKGERTGQMANLVYTFYRNDEGFEQMEPTERKGWYKVHFAVPYFDHCGMAIVIELRDGDFVE